MGLRTRVRSWISGGLIAAALAGFSIFDHNVYKDDPIHYLPASVVSEHRKSLRLIGESAGDIEDFQEDYYMEDGLHYTKLAYEELPTELLDEHHDALVQIAQAAGPFTGDAYANLPIDLMNGFSDELLQIAQASGTEAGLTYEFLPITSLENNPDEIVEIVDRYEDSAWGIFKAFGEDSIEKERKYRSIFEQIKEVAGDGASEAYGLFSTYYRMPNSKEYDFFLQLAKVAGPETTWAWYMRENIHYSYKGQEKPEKDNAELDEFLLQIAEETGEGTAAAYMKLRVELIDDHQDFLLQVAQFAGKETDRAYESLTTKLVDEHQDFLLEIAKATREETAVAFESLPVELIDDHQDFLLELVQVSGTGRAYGALPVELIDDHQDFLLEIAKATGEGIWDAYERLPVELVDEHSTELVQIAQAAEGGTWCAYTHLDADLLDKDPDTSIKIAEAAKNNTFCVYDHFSMELMIEHPDTLVKIALSVEDGIIETSENIPIELLDEHADELARIAQAAGWNTPLAYEHLPVKLMDEHSTELAEFAEKYGEATGYLFKKYGNRVLKFEEGYGDLTQRSKDVFGITHVHRYMKGSLATGLTNSLLEENLRNLDPEYNADKPIGVVVYNKHDWNGYFANPWAFFNLSRLSRNYKLFIFETDNEDDAFAAIEQIGLLNGLDENDDIARPIDLLVLSGHGNQYTLNLGYSEVQDNIESPDDISEYDSQYLDVTDVEQFSEASQYIAQNGVIVLDSCSTGKGREDADNLANSIHNNILHVDVFSPEIPAGIAWYDLNKDGMVQDVLYVYNLGLGGYKAEAEKFDEVQSMPKDEN